MCVGNVAEDGLISSELCFFKCGFSGKEIFHYLWDVQDTNEEFLLNHCVCGTFPMPKNEVSVHVNIRGSWPDQGMVAQGIK